MRKYAVKRIVGSENTDFTGDRELEAARKARAEQKVHNRQIRPVGMTYMEFLLQGGEAMTEEEANFYAKGLGLIQE